MSLIAETQYYAKVITVDKQGNQTTSAQQSIVSDALHNADVHPDLQQNFRAEGSSQSCAAGIYGAITPVIFNTLLYNSGSGAYNTSTGIFTVGQTGKMIFFANVGIRESGPTGFPAGASGQLEFLQNSAHNALGQSAVPIQDGGGNTTFTLLATIAGSIAVTIGDQISIQFLWNNCAGLPLSNINHETAFEGRITPG